MRKRLTSQSFFTTVLTAGGDSSPCLVIKICWIFFGPQIERSRFSVQIRRSTSSIVRQVTDFGARLCSSKPFIPPAAWRAAHLWPVCREIPKSQQSSVMVK